MAADRSRLARQGRAIVHVSKGYCVQTVIGIYDQ